jgi:hypothetical protein
MIIFLLQNITIILSAVLITRLYFNFSGIIDNILCAGTLYFSYIVLVQLALGSFNILTIETILVINLVILGAAVLLLRFKCANFRLSNADSKVSFNGLSKFNQVLISLILGFALVKLAINLVNPPFGWDSLNYHFPFAVEWLKNHNLSVPIVISDNPCPSYYPLNGCLIYLWYIFPFSNSFLADLGQAPFFIMSLFCLYNICRKLGVSKQFSFFASVLMAATPNYFKQLSIAYVDVMVCAWFLMAVNFLLNLRQASDFKNSFLFGLCVGMLTGTKTIACAYAIVPVLFFLYLIFPKKNTLSGVFKLVIFLAAVFLIGSFWYIRDFLETGNPVYPLTLKLLGKTFFPGVMGKESFTVFSGARDYSLGKILFHEGLGSGVLLFLMPGVVMFGFNLIKSKTISAKEAVLAGSFLSLFLIYNSLFSLPNVRYLYPLIALGYIMAFYALSRVNFPLKIVKWLVLLCLIASLPEMARRQELVWGFIISLGLFMALTFWCKPLMKHLGRVLLACLCLSIFILWFESIDYRKNEFKRYVKMVKYSGFWPDAAKAWEWLNANTKGNNIAYIGRPVPFPLYGSGLKNNVYYVSLNSVDPVKLHYFPGASYSWGKDYLSLHKNLEEKGNYRENAQYSDWLANLLRRKTDYLFVYSLHQTKETLFPLEDEWARAHADIFSLVFSNATIRIYKVKL